MTQIPDGDNTSAPLAAAGSSPLPPGHIEIAQKAINWSAMALLAWCILSARPYYVLVSACLLLPWLALWACYAFPDTFAILAEKDAERINPGSALAFPCIALCIRAFSDIEMVDYSPALLLGVAGGALVAGLALRRWRSATAVIGTFVIFSMYFASAVVLANSQFDEGKPAWYSATVKAKLRSAVRVNREYDYYFRISPSDGLDSNEVEAAEEQYKRLERGDQVCVTVHPGAFGYKWYVVSDTTDCPAMRPVLDLGNVMLWFGGR